MTDRPAISIDTFSNLRLVEDNVKRGYAFEQIVREFLPWNFRAPIAYVANSEQLDAFFEFNGWHFLVESKAKETKITPGSHDWEDFELKVRKRGGSCIGLFCSLWPVTKQIHEYADKLNGIHHTTIVISGRQWDELVSENMDVGLFLRFLVQEARAKGKSSVPSVAEIKRLIVDQSKLETNVRDLLRSYSVTFLRRYRSPRHKLTYLKRGIDADIKNMISALKPTQLVRKTKLSNIGGKSIELAREAPTQVAVLLDLSGAGKTTLSVELADLEGIALPMVQAALEPNIDSLPDRLARIGARYGVGELQLIDKPALLVIDSLDEAIGVAHKHTEVRSLFKAIDELNSSAAAVGLICYPILLLFTVRYEYWRHWESLFEGRKARHFTKKFSTFLDSEMDVALTKYQDAFGYKIVGSIRSDLREALVHPFLLQVYSEANEYAGQIDTTDHFGPRVLQLYFDRKKEDVLKRPIPGYTGEYMMRLCSDIAMLMAKVGRRELLKSEVVTEIGRSIPMLSAHAEEILTSLRSEQILSADGSGELLYRFRHSRFLEYCLATHLLRSIRDLDDASAIEAVHNLVTQHSIASSIGIVDNLKSLIVNSKELTDKVDKSISGSSEFMSTFATNVRSYLANGEKIQPEQISKLKLGIANRSSGVTWDGFFVLASRAADQPNGIVSEAFSVAWDTNRNRADLWKMLPKMGRRGLLLSESVLLRVLKSRDIKLWEVFMQTVLDFESSAFATTWLEIEGPILESEFESLGSEWSQVIAMISDVRDLSSVH